MKVSEADYEFMRSWLAHMAREVFPTELLASGADPISQLDLIASHSPAKARQGLSMAVGDIVELTNNWSKQRVAATDLSLRQGGFPNSLRCA